MTNPRTMADYDGTLTLTELDPSKLACEDLDLFTYSDPDLARAVCATLGYDDTTNPVLNICVYYSRERNLWDLCAMVTPYEYDEWEDDFFPQWEDTMCFMTLELSKQSLTAFIEYYFSVGDWKPLNGLTMEEATRQTISDIFKEHGESFTIVD